MTARAQTWSNYKHHNTVKYLVGITPQGTISFISNGWGGRVSDKHLTANSKFISKLIHEDLVLADRGFEIQDLVAIAGAEVQYPAFTRGKGQLSATEIEAGMCFVVEVHQHMCGLSSLWIVSFYCLVNVIRSFIQCWRISVSVNNNFWFDKSN